MSNKSSDPSTGSRYTRALRLLAALAMVLGMLAANLPARPVRAATYTVTSTADSGAGTLRDAINQVNAGGGGDTIDISATGTILLTSWLPQLAKNVTINGPGANLLAIDGAGLYRPFIVASTVTDATISGLTIRHGYTTSLGGAIFNDGTLTVMNSTLSDNTSSGTAYGSGGGAIANRPGRTLTVTNSTFFHNSAAYGGGAIEVVQSSSTPYSVTVTNSSFTNNSAPTGGAIDAWNGGTLTVTNSTFTGNSATSGGGIYKTYTGQMTLTNDTFAGNSASSSGGGIRNFGPATLTNVIVATNSAPVGPDIYGGSGSAGHNLIGTTSDANGITDGVNGDIVTPTPLLGTLGDNGGSTQTIPLLPGSPAINAGTAAGAPNSDQRGRSRVDTPDIGAFESQGFTLTKTGGDNQSTLVNTAFTSPLAVAIAPVNAGEPVNGGQVTFTAPTTGAGATFSGNPATIISDGTASLTATANDSAGTYQVTASAAGANAVNFDLENISVSPAVDAANSTVSADPTSVVADGSSTSTITVTLLDASSNPVSDRDVILGADTGSSVISPVSVTTDANGQATFTVSDTVPEVVTYTATDTTDTVTITQTASVTFTTGAVDHFAISQISSSQTVDGSFSIIVTAKDAYNHTVTSFTGPVSLSVATGNISPETSGTFTSGVWTGDVTVNTAAESQTITASDGTRTGTSISFTVNPATITTTTTVTSNPTITYSYNVKTVQLSATVIASQPVNSGGVTFTVKDANGNTVGSPALTGISNGQATVTYSIPANQAVGSYTIVADYTGSNTANYLFQPGSSNPNHNGTLTITPETYTTNTSVTSSPTVAYSASDRTVQLSARIGSYQSVNVGTVTFTVKSGNTVVGIPVTSATVVSGTASASYTIPARQAAGSYTIVADYSGGSSSNYSFQATSSDPNSNGNLIITSGNVSTETTMPAGPWHLFYSPNAQTLVFSAQVEGAQPVNAGTVTFTIKDANGTTIGTPATSGTVDGGSTSAGYIIPAGQSAGSYTIVAEYSGDASGDYIFLASSSDPDFNSDLLIQQVTVTTTTLVTSNPTLTYGATGRSVTLSADLSGDLATPTGQVIFSVAHDGALIGWPTTATLDGSGHASVDYALPANLPVGNYGIMATYYGEASGNYNFLYSYGTGTLIINSAPATINITNTTQTYDGSAKSVSVTTDPSDLAYTVVYKQDGTTVDQPINAGTYDVTATINPGQNYSGTQTGTLTINKADATINVTGYSVTYDGQAHTATATATGVNGEDLSNLLDLSGTTHTNAGTYTGDKWSFAGNTNYQSASGMVDDVIRPEPVTITITNTNQTYDGTAKTVTVTTDPSDLAYTVVYKQGDTVVTSPTASGAYDVTVTITDPNYNGTQTDTLTIEQPAGAPEAQDTSATVVSGGSVSITLTATDSDSASLTFSIASEPSHGSVTDPVKVSCKKVKTGGVTCSTTVTYTSDTTGYAGTDSFSFKANDGMYDSNEATVTVTVKPAPVQTLHLAFTAASLNVRVNTMSRPLMLQLVDQNGKAVVASEDITVTLGTTGAIDGAFYDNAGKPITATPLTVTILKGSSGVNFYYMSSSAKSSGTIEAAADGYTTPASIAVTVR